jgi:hypothetical protein
MCCDPDPKNPRSSQSSFEQSLINVCAAAQESDEWMLDVHHVADMHKKNENVGELIFNLVIDSQSVYLNSLNRTILIMTPSRLHPKCKMYSGPMRGMYVKELVKCKKGTYPSVGVSRFTCRSARR